MRRRLIISIALVFFQQVSGNANVLYYAPMIFQLVGFCSNSALLASVGIGCMKVVMAVVAVPLVDRCGRRFFLLLGTTLMAVSVFVLGMVLLAIPELALPLKCTDVPTNETAVPLPNATMVETVANCSQFQHLAVFQKSLALVTLMTYVSAYQLSFGVVTWLIMSEIFPTAVRGRAVSLTTAVNWAANLLVSLTFLDFLEFAGIGAVFITYSGICAAAAAFIFIFVPETKKKSLEEIDAIMKDRFRCPAPKPCRQFCCCGVSTRGGASLDYLNMEGRNDA